MTIRIILSLFLSFVAASTWALNCASPNIELERVFKRLPALNGAIDMKPFPADGSHWLMALRSGELHVFENSKNASSTIKSLDISLKVDVRLEMGLTGVALHPNYPKDRRVFVIYNNKFKNGLSTLSSFEMDEKTFKINPDSENVLLTLPQPQLNHNGGYVSFGPDNHLYLAFGDGGYDPATSQDQKNLYGSLLKINVDQKAYRSAKGNPQETHALCSQGKGAEACPEIFAYGFRNPWRFSFDKETHELWLADVGEENYEEINRITKGQNYGWPIMEGPECSEGKPCNKKGLALPITGYDNPNAQSIFGGYVYRGSEFPELIGHYIFADTFAPMLYSVPASAKEGTQPKLHGNTGLKAVSFAQDINGELYVLNFEDEGGEAIWQVVSRLRTPCDK